MGRSCRAKFLKKMSRLKLQIKSEWAFSNDVSDDTVLFNIEDIEEH